MSPYARIIIDDSRKGAHAALKLSNPSVLHIGSIILGVLWEVNYRITPVSD